MRSLGLDKLFSGLNRLLMIGLLQVVFWAGWAIASPAMAVELKAELLAQAQQPFNPESIDTADLESAADVVEQAADDVYEGLETTKRIKGKTELRNQKIEEGRDEASSKLQNLAEKARSAESLDDLTVPEQRILRHYHEVN
ncbi:MAG: hypothetical protein F6K04_13660 [Leptolyngbya sp. SIO4C5]|nr:hypothetical protein [Leptolyngbya sp. SIO4C5]